MPSGFPRLIPEPAHLERSLVRVLVIDAPNALGRALLRLVSGNMGVYFLRGVVQVRLTGARSRTRADHMECRDSRLWDACSNKAADYIQGCGLAPCFWQRAKADGWAASRSR